jgi:hypothetical protein
MKHSKMMFGHACYMLCDTKNSLSEICMCSKGTSRAVPCAKYQRIHLENMPTPISLSFLLVSTTAVCKVRGLTLLLRVETMWRCGDGLFLKYLPWQTIHFLQRSTHFSKTCCRPLMTLKFLASELPFHGWKSPEIAWCEIWTVWRTF